MKITQWHKGNEKPIRAGVYQRRLFNITAWSKWDGKKWHQYNLDYRKASESAIKSRYQDLKWRGVTK